MRRNLLRRSAAAAGRGDRRSTIRTCASWAAAKRQETKRGTIKTEDGQARGNFSWERITRSFGTLNNSVARSERHRQPRMPTGQQLPLSSIRPTAPRLSTSGSPTGGQHLQYALAYKKRTGKQNYISTTKQAATRNDHDRAGQAKLGIRVKTKLEIKTTKHIT